MIYFAWVAWFPYILFATPWMAGYVFGGDPTATKGPTFDQYQNGKHFSSMALAANAATMLVFTTLQPKLISLMKPRAFLAFGLSLHVRNHPLIIVVVECPCVVFLAGDFTTVNSVDTPRRQMACVYNHRSSRDTVVDNSVCSLHHGGAKSPTERKRGADGPAQYLYCCWTIHRAWGGCHFQPVVIRYAGSRGGVGAHCSTGVVLCPQHGLVRIVLEKKMLIIHYC